MALPNELSLELAGLVERLLAMPGEIRVEFVVGLLQGLDPRLSGAAYYDAALDKRYRELLHHLLEQIDRRFYSAHWAERGDYQ